MLGLVIVFMLGAFVGLLVGVWLVADNTRHTTDACLAFGRPWYLAQPHAHGSNPTVRLIEPLDIDVDLDVPNEN